MIVHPLMEFELCFACVLLMTCFAIDEIGDIFGFAGHRLFDDMFIAIICAADGGIEQPWFTGLTSGVRVARPESRGGWYVLFLLVLGCLMDFETLLILEYEATFGTLFGAGWGAFVGESGLIWGVACAVLAISVIWGRQSLCRCMWCQSFADKHVAKISSSPVAYKGYFPGRLQYIFQKHAELCVIRLRFLVCWVALDCRWLRMGLFLGFFGFYCLWGLLLLWLMRPCWLHLAYSLFCSPSGEDGVSFHGYVFEKGCQLNKCIGDVGPDNRVSLFWYVWGDNWWNISTDVCWWILRASERCTEIFHEVPLVSYRRARNLCDILVSKRLAPHTSTETLPTPNHRNSQNSTSNPPNQTRFTNESSSPSTNQCSECGLILKNQKGLKIHQTSKHQRKQNIPTSPGFWPCHSDTRCETCKSGLFYTSISSTNNGYKHIIKHPMTCKTKNVCYLINSKKCGQQYTGETQLEFHKRMNNHTSDIRQKKKSMGMVRHFAKCGLNNIQPIILERVRSSDPFIRKAREQFYINIFGTEINAQ